MSEGTTKLKDASSGLADAQGATQDAKEEQPPRRAVQAVHVVSESVAFQVTRVLSTLAAIVGLFGAMFATQYTGEWTRGFLDPVQHQESTLEVSYKLKALEERIENAERAIASSASTDFSEASLMAKVEENGARLEGIEMTLDMRPRELIELIQLRDELSDLKLDTKERITQVIRELDRAFNLMLAVVGALLVSVVAMIAGSFLQKRNTE